MLCEWDYDVKTLIRELGGAVQNNTSQARSQARVPICSVQQVGAVIFPRRRPAHRAALTHLHFALNSYGPYEESAPKCPLLLGR